MTKYTTYKLEKKMIQKKTIVIGIAIMIIVGIIGITIQKYNKASQQTINSQMIEILTQDRFQILLQSNKKPYVIFCYLDGCPWCEAMDPIVQKTAKKSEFRSLQFYKIESDLVEDSKLIQKIIGKKIDGYPFCVCMNQGMYIGNKDGYLEQDTFEKELKQSFPKL